MIRLILKYLDKIKQFFLIIPILIGIMVFAGLFFAHEKSEPMFVSKADRVMFEIKDKSPKYVMTLPEEKEETPDESSVLEENSEKVEEKHLTNNEKLNELDIPFLAKLPQRNASYSLTYISPNNYLTEENEAHLKLPIKKETMVPWSVYGKKVDVMPMFSKVAIVVKNVGPNHANAELIIQRLPSEVSISFSPYTTSLDVLVGKARSLGHETYLDMILPPRDIKNTDPGLLALDFSMSPEENIEILEKQLSQNIAIGGFIISDGIDDIEYNDYFISIMSMLEKRGLLMLDATHGLNIGANNVQGLDRVRADIIIDEDFNRDAINKKLAQAESRALNEGSVVVVVDPKPVVILAVNNWLSTFSEQLTYDEMKLKGINSFEKPLALVPLSNLVGEY